MTMALLMIPLTSPMEPSAVGFRVVVSILPAARAG
jgi:hypothetical protein